MPKIKARFRKYKNIPFAIEQLTGVQYRCRVCNRIFLNKNEFVAHLERESKKQGPLPLCKKCPSLNETIEVRVLYSKDIHDHMRKDFLKLKDDITYDEI
ncbi:MAG: hypothetical protein J7L94_06345 [Caldisericaceae bacterium]|nr:hypothetical protein [Caldisericaceae bacterium]